MATEARLTRTEHRDYLMGRIKAVREYAELPGIDEAEMRERIVHAANILGIDEAEARELAWLYGLDGRGTHEHLVGDLARHYARTWIAARRLDEGQPLTPCAKSVRAALRAAGIPGLYDEITSGRRRTWVRLAWLDSKAAREEQRDLVLAALRAYFVEHGDFAEGEMEHGQRVHLVIDSTIVVDRHRRR